METITTIPSIDIQCNWNEVPRNGKFWVSCRQAGEKTVHGSLTKPQSGQQGDGFFVVRDHSMHSLTVECPEAKITTKFVQPWRVMHLHNQKLLCGDVSASGGLGVCSSEDGQLWVWDADLGETRRTLGGHVGDVYSCRFFPSGVVVLSGGADLRLKIWSALDGSCPRTLVGHSRGITDTAIIDKGRNIISVSKDGTAKLWDCGTGSNLATMAPTQCPINSCALGISGSLPETSSSPPLEPECGTSCKLLLLACEDGNLRGCDVRNKETVFSCGGVGDAPLSSCVFVSETQALAGSEDGVIATVDLRSPRTPMSLISLAKSSVNSLLVLEGQNGVCGLSDGSCVVWSLDNSRTTFTKLTGPDVDPVTSVRLSAGKLFTTCRDGCVRVYQQADVS